MKTNNLNKILNQPSYWVEKVNATIFNAIIDFMEENNMKNKDLAEHLGISKGRVSQILNEGDINFSIEKVIQIALKVGVYPEINFEKKEAYIDKLNSKEKSEGLCINYLHDDIFSPQDFNTYFPSQGEAKVVSISDYQEVQIAL